MEKQSRIRLSSAALAPPGAEPFDEALASAILASLFILLRHNLTGQLVRTGAERPQLVIPGHGRCGLDGLVAIGMAQIAGYLAQRHVALPPRRH